MQVCRKDTIRREGLFDTVSQSLLAQDIEIVALGGIVRNPLLSKVREGIDLARPALCPEKVLDSFSFAAYRCGWTHRTGSSEL